MTTNNPFLKNTAFFACMFLVWSIFTTNLPAIAAAPSPEAVGSVVAVRGNVVAVDGNGLSRQLKIKNPVYLEDTLKTGKKGRLQVMFQDQTIISLGRKSEMKIAAYAFNQEKKTGKMTTEVKEGVFRVMGGILTKNSPGNFYTNTPSGVIGIRGSMYAGNVKGTQVSIVFEAGKGITVRNKTGMVAITKPGFGTHIKGSKDPLPPPFKFKAKDLRSLHTELTFAKAGKPGTTPRGGTSGIFRPPVTFTKDNAAGLKKSGTTDLAPEKNQASEDQPEEAAEDKEGEKEKPEKEKIEKETDNKNDGAAEEGESADEKSVTEQAAQLTEAVLANPEAAGTLLRDAVQNGGMNVDDALVAVLQGLRNPSREVFENVLNEVLSNKDKGDITVDELREIPPKLKAEGVCK